MKKLEGLRHSSLEEVCHYGMGFEVLKAQARTRASLYLCLKIRT